jgi:molybdopterin adenylyltransferase
MMDIIDIPAPGGWIDETVAFAPARIAVLTISDSRGPDNDSSGQLLADLVKRDGHHLVARDWVKDDSKMISTRIRTWIIDPGINVILSTGGTGLTGRDVTPDAVRPLFEKEIEGFQTVWHLVSYQSVGLSTLAARACAGIANGTFIFALPGSGGACRDGWEKIIRWQLDNRHKPCNFQGIMPRLMEGR